MPNTTRNIFLLASPSDRSNGYALVALDLCWHLWVCSEVQLQEELTRPLTCREVVVV